MINCVDSSSVPERRGWVRTACVTECSGNSLVGGHFPLTRNVGSVGFRVSSRSIGSVCSKMSSVRRVTFCRSYAVGV